MNTKKAPCAFCHGTGTRSPVNGMTCPTCDGKGTIFVDYHSWAKDETCMDCLGKGKIEAPVTCPACNGSGEID